MKVSVLDTEKWSYHAPPQGVGIAGEARLPLLVHRVLLGQVHKVGGEDEPQEADVQSGDQLLWRPR